MRIAFFGSSLVSSYWNGAATYYRGLLKALARVGHEITFYEPDAFDRQAHRDIPDPDWAKVVVYPATEDGWRSALNAGCRGVDLIVKASGIGVFDKEFEIAVPALARAGVLTAYWDVDAPATLDSISGDPQHHLRSAIPHYDLVFTYGGGDPVVSAYLHYGARRCVPIYNAVDPETHHRSDSRPDYQCDLSFLGNRLPDRERRVEEFFLRPAQLLPDRSFLLAGAGWADKQVPGNVRVAGHVGSGDHNAFFCSGMATLNVNRDSMARYGFSPPTRIFEAAGAAACVITDAWEGIEQFLDPGDEVLVASDGEEVAAILNELSPSTAERIGRRGQARILAEHTYSHRARQVAAVLDVTNASSEAAE